ncbi:MAG TPA: hypothetical protein VKP69_12900, partial [Isosphaeraceae bacterium]|nr:hypothetical protein [Isosphaeraceae bacterium]
ESGNLRPLASASEFYLAVSHIRPGETVTVRRARGGEAFADVALRVGQGVDERKPLLSLLVMRGAGAGEGTWSWVGWNPLGPYEASGPDAERRLGWHFNTGQPEMPTRFALADQYRKYRREGLLRDLIEQGQLAPPAAPKPLPRPDLGLTLDPEGEIDGQGRTLVRRAPGALDLTLLDRTWTAEEVESVRWALDDAPARPMAPAGAERTWSADLSQVAWARGVHRVAVTLRTREATPQEFTEKRLVRLVPPPPRIETEMPASTLVVSRPEFTFRARVTPSRGPVKVRLVHQSGGGVRPPRERKADGPLVIDEPLTLEPGSNTIELSAENAEAPPADRELETSRLAPRIIVYNRVPAIPPSVMLEGITVLRGGVEGGPTRPAGGGEPVVVTAPKVRVEGRITAQEKLSGAEWLRSEGAKAQRLAGFLPDRETAFTIREAIDLAPGVQRLRFRARAADSATTEAEVTIDYRPPVPEVADVVLDPSDAVVYAAPGADPPHARLRARLIATGDRHPFEAAILVNGEEQPGRPVIDEAAGTLTAEVPLQPGDNRIQVRLGNAWRSAWITEPVGVTYRRPPRVVALETGAVGDRPFLDVSARVESPDDLPPTRGKVVVKGKRASGAEIDVGEFRRDEAAWVLSAREVPIEPGENAVEVWAWNDDGRSREPGRRAGIIYRAPPPPKPEVEFLSPARDTTVSTPAPAVEFRVRSESPLTKVELLRLRSESDRQVVHAADVAKLLKGAQGRFEVRAAPVVTLVPQDNLLRVVAVNAGGESTASLRLSYLPPPVRVVVDRIKPREPGAKPVAPAVREDNRIIFADPVPSGRITMQGRVIWPDEQSRRQKGAGRVQVWVNGLPQVHVPLRPHADRALEGTFEAKILLGREDNQVEIKVPELAREAGDRPVFRLACARPEGHQRLHLLIVGVGQEDEVALRNRALQALQGRLREGSTTAFATPAFSEGRIYGPLAHDVKKTQLLYQLGLIRNAINPLQTATEAPNEVVLIYYQGGEWVDQGKSYLRLRTGRGRNQSDVIALEELAGLFTGTRGAHLFLLDVTRSRVAPIGPALRAASWPGDDDVPIGLLQFAWLNPADAAPGESPQDARLITALQEAMPKAATVREVTAKVRQRAERLGKRYPNLYYDQLLTPPIAELIIGRP